MIIWNFIVASFLEGRQGDQCLHRYTQTLQMVRKGKWTADEDEVRFTLTGTENCFVLIRRKENISCQTQRMSAYQA